MSSVPLRIKVYSVKLIQSEAKRVFCTIFLPWKWKEAEQQCLCRNLCRNRVRVRYRTICKSKREGGLLYTIFLKGLGWSREQLYLQVFHLVHIW